MVFGRGRGGGDGNGGGDGVRSIYIYSDVENRGMCAIEARVPF